MNLQSGTASAGFNSIHTASAGIKPQSAPGLAGDALENSICLMSLETLRSYASTCCRKIKHFEEEVNRLQSEIQTRESQHARRNRELHQATSVRDGEITRNLKQAEFELAAERSIRKDLEVEQSRLRDLCKKAKNRITELVAHRSELESKNEDLAREIEELNNQLAQSAVFQEHLRQQVEAQQQEIARQKYRGSRLEQVIQHYDLHAQLRALSGLVNSVWKQIEGVQQQHSAVNDQNQINQRTLELNNSAPFSSETYHQFVGNLASRLPSIPVDLSTITSLPTLDCNFSNMNKLNSKSISLFSTSAGDTLCSVSSSVTDGDVGDAIEEMISPFDGVGPDDNQPASPITSSIPHRSNNREPSVLHPSCISLQVEDEVMENLANRSDCATRASVKSSQRKARRGNQRKGLMGMRGRPRGAEELYPVPTQLKTNRITASIRKVRSDTFRNEQSGKASGGETSVKECRDVGVRIRRSTRLMVNKEKPLKKDD